MRYYVESQNIHLVEAAIKTAHEEGYFIAAENGARIDLKELKDYSVKNFYFDPEKNILRLTESFCSSCDESLNLPEDWFKTQAIFKGAFKFYQIEDYKVSLYRNGSILFGCTLVRPTIVKNFIEALNPNKNKPTKSALCIYGDSYLLDAAEKFLVEEKHIGWVTECNRKIGAQKDFECFYIVYVLEDERLAMTTFPPVNPIAKETTLYLSKDWDKLSGKYDEVDSLYADGIEPADIIRVGNYDCSVNPQGFSIYADGGIDITINDLYPLIDDWKILMANIAKKKTIEKKPEAKKKIKKK